MQYKRIQKDQVTVLVIKGEVTIDTVDGLRAELEKLYNEGARKIVVDFAQVTYIDSVGLALFIEFLQRFRQNNGEIALANMQDKIAYLFEIAKIDMMMSIYGNQKDAIASM